MEKLTTDQKVNVIYEELVGSKDFNRPGLIKRVEFLEKKAGILDLFWAKVTGGILVLSIIGTGLFSFISWLYNKAIH